MGRLPRHIVRGKKSESNMKKRVYKSIADVYLYTHGMRMHAQPQPQSAFLVFGHSSVLGLLFKDMARSFENI